MTRRAMQVFGLAVASMALVAAFYGRGLHFDLQCDDLLLIRPWSAAQLEGIWHGRSEPLGVFVTFFRPLTSLFYAMSFDLFGLNNIAHMTLSLALLAAVVCLLATVVLIETSSLATALVAAALYLAHPNTSWATGVWITNDFHKLAAIAALSAVLLWQRLRHHPASAKWVWFAVPCVASFLVKEDGLMLIPALLWMQRQWARRNASALAPSRSVIAAAAVLAAALVAWRTFSIAGLGGFALPRSIEEIARNLVRGPLYVFGYQEILAPMSFAMIALALAWIAVIAGLLLRARRKDQELVAIGLTLMFWYNLPLAVVNNVMRYYLLTIGGTLVLAPALVSLWRSTTTSKAIGAALLASVLVFSTAKQQHSLSEFAPCGRTERECVGWVLEELVTLPPEARAYVANTQMGCSTGQRRPIGAAGTLTWGVGASVIDTMDGDSSRPMTQSVTMLVNAAATHVHFDLQYAGATPDSPVDVHITVNGDSRTVHVSSSSWTPVELNLARGWRTRLRGAHRVDVTADVPGQMKTPVTTQQ